MIAVLNAHDIARPMGCQPSLTPTIAPLGVERLIRVRYVHSGDVVVRGGVTGREYRFSAGEAREIPLSDARILVSEGDFAFTGGR
jgi:hypothetical protein